MAEIMYAYILGIFSILSPCTFIIIPVMTSNMGAKLKTIISFLAGIVVIFGLLGILSALTGKLLTNFIGPYLYLFAGVVTAIAGLNMLELIELNLPAMFSNIKPKNNFITGLLYGGVALSCVGPLMATVMVYITAKASLFYGFIMMSIYSLGFITPFVIFGLLITDKKISRKLMIHLSTIRKIGGALLLLVSAYLLFIALKGIL